MQEKQIPGLSVAVLKQGKIVKLTSYGLADLEHQIPVTRETVFPIASITKTFTSTAILLLVEEGKLRLDQPMAEVLPDLPEGWRKITIRQCLSHTSGLPDSWKPDHRLWQQPENWDALRALVFHAPLEFPAGTQCSYNQTGYQLLGEVVARISGVPFAEFVQERLLKPVGLRGARFNRYRSDRGNAFLTPIVPHLVSNYEEVGGVLQHAAFYRPVWDQPTAGLLLTVDDLIQWDRALAQGSLVRRATLEEAWTPTKLNDGTAAKLWWGSYGLGWFVGEHRGHRYVGHLGGNSVWYGHFPDLGLTVIVLTNRENSNPADIALNVADFYLRKHQPMPEARARSTANLSAVTQEQ
jgi:CubicO group peptidase (beta-lactamase class C family)